MGKRTEKEHEREGGVGARGLYFQKGGILTIFDGLCERVVF